MLCVNIDKLYELQGEMNETQMAKKIRDQPLSVMEN